MDLDISPDVSDALANNRPIVALETTVITHGMSFPDNVETAFAMEQAIRAEQACPATIGVVGGRITVGMTRQQIESFGKAGPGKVVKCSRRDIPAVMAAGSNGSLTVAGTIAVAAAAGIRILSTGGIGGVHRGHAQDVSADLHELGRTAVACVCSGAKSILDLPATLEVLESLGITVIGLGTSRLPAFFARDSGLSLPHCVHSVDEAADVLRAWRDFDSSTGLLLAVPVPEGQALPAEDAEKAVAMALREAGQRNIQGNDVTPFLLQHIAASTNGRSLIANKALLINNARLAAVLARTADLGHIAARI